MAGGWAKKGLMGKYCALGVKIPHYMECSLPKYVGLVEFCCCKYIDTAVKSFAMKESGRYFMKTFSYTLYENEETLSLGPFSGH